jgi:3'-phosphoadenosine 5'-phosphosulfate sulfotransferase (PAPS reductase)/FAD synthetase
MQNEPTADSLMNPYRINEPAAISFSGGRTSAFMLFKVLEAHDGQLPDDVVVTFANTGKEMPETLDFVQACSDNWGVDIVWLEYDGRTQKENSKNYDYRYKVVNRLTASQHGEPFSLLVKETGRLPNPVMRYCSGQLKVRTIFRYMTDHGFETPYLTLIGIRADEKRRAVKLHNRIIDRQENYCPMYEAGHTKHDVVKFWSTQNFDLGLHHNNGVTDFGNCDLCFLKGQTKRMSIIRERPDLVEWWIEKENAADDQFDRYGPSYAEMKLIASDQGSLFMFDNDESIPCFCGD